MPETTSATWPSLVAGAKAKASDVESKFDWLEGHLWPQVGGTTTTGVFDLGGNGKSWRSLWATSINPTTTAGGVAVFTTTVANASVGFEIAGARALLIPRLTTAQRTGLTAIAGMMVYDSDLGVFQVYENGAWQTMGGKNGIIAKTTTTLPFGGATQTVMEVTGSGRIRSIILGDGANELIKSMVSLVIDSVSAAQVYASTTGAGYVVLRSYPGADQTATFPTLSAANDITTTVAGLSAPTDIYFKSQVKIYGWNPSGSGAGAISVIIEKS